MGFDANLQWQPEEDISTTEIVDSAVATAKIAGGAVTAPKLATDNASSILVDHADASPVTLLAAAAVTRLVRSTAICSETLGGTTPATIKVGITGTLEALFSVAELAPSTGAGDSGDILDKRYVLPAGEALIATVTPGTGGTPAGKITFWTTATPMPTP